VTVECSKARRVSRARGWYPDGFRWFWTVFVMTGQNDIHIFVIGLLSFGDMHQFCWYLLIIVGFSYVAVAIQSVSTASTAIHVYGHCVLTEIQLLLLWLIRAISFRWIVNIIVYYINSELINYTFLVSISDGVLDEGDSGLMNSISF